MATSSEKQLPEAMRTMWLKAMSAYELKNYGYAVQLVQTVLREVPDFLTGRQLARKATVARHAGKKSFFGGLSGSTFSMMKIQGMLKKNPREALDAIEKVLENEPYNAQANQLLKEAALLSDMPETAAFALQTIIEGNPKDTKTMHELAKHYMQFDAPDKAVEVYNDIIKVSPHDLIAVKGGKDAAAKASMKHGGWETAETYRDLIKNKDEAVALEQQSRVVKDVATIDSLLAELYPKAEGSIDVSRRMAELYEQKEDFTDSLKWYEYASQLMGNSDPGILRKISDLRLRQLDECIEAREDYIKQNGPDGADSKTFEAELVELHQQRAQLAVEDARIRVERNPTDLIARFELGEILLRSGNPDDAIPELQKARQNPSVRLRAMGFLAECYTAKSMLDLAAKTLLDASSEISVMDATKKDLLYNLGLVYEKMNNKEKSIDCMKQIYEVDYGYKDVARRVESSY